MPDAPLISPAELPSWIIEEDDDFIVFNKPGWVVCHPSKNGPWSSLVGAVREWRGLETIHLVSRLDRETSGVLLFAKNKTAASQSQSAMERRHVSKTYLTILAGEMKEPVNVDEPLAPDTGSRIAVKSKVAHVADAQHAVTLFEPLYVKNGYTLCRVFPHTGRKHQIRIHAQHLGFPVVGDKLYGADENLYLEFVETSWGARHDALLEMPRQALHAARLEFKSPDFRRTFSAPLPDDMKNFCAEKLDLDAAQAFLPAGSDCF